MELAERIAAIASDKKAIDVRLLDLRGVVGYTDYFVICSGNTERQTKAIHDAIHQELKDSSGLLPRRTEGETVSTQPYESVEEWLERKLGVAAPERPPGL